MSGIAGIYNLDGQPAGRAFLERMMSRIAHRGSDGLGYWIHGPVALGHRMLCTTPESLRERQPLSDETGILCLALDGRIDNRAELISNLQARGAKLRTDTDAEIVLAAYRHWGEDCPRYLIGDFALVIWDEAQRHLFCARDPLGIKPFYYYADGHTFVCGSELQQLFEHPAIRREPNEGMIGEYLASEITSQEETLYKSLYRLPPAHALTVGSSRFKVRRYWDITPAAVIHYKTDSEYAAHFSDIFQEAVRCRLRSHRPVGSYLSGGLDSSSVVSMAQSLCRDGVGVAHGCESFSLLFPGLPCDESPYIRDVVNRWGLRSHTVDGGEPDLSYAECAEEDLDFPGYPNGLMANPLRALARERGVRVLLTGGGGDEWLAGSSSHAADLLRGLKLRAFWRRLAAESGTLTISQQTCMALRHGLWPLLPPPARAALRTVLKREKVPPWLNSQFARRIHLAERIGQESDGRQFLSHAQADLHGILTSGWWPHSAEVEDRAAARFDLEERHPLSDRRIVEFALALPEEQRWRGDQQKFILRQSMQGLLPETVRQRLTKGEFSPVFAAAFRALGGQRFFDSLAVVSWGWVDEQAVRSMCRDMMQDRRDGSADSVRYLWPLWMIAGIELWLTSVFLTPGRRSHERVALKEAAAQPV